MMSTANTKHMTDREFSEWLSGHGGRSIVYAVGALAASIRDAFAKEDPSATVLSKLQERTYRAYQQGDVYLTQRRLGAFKYEYVATRTSGNGR